MMIPIAHTGHWLAGLLYLTPVVVLAAAIGWQRHNDRHAHDSEPDRPQTED
ncbi:MAG: hypothetical protein WAO61_06275 [Solirubrobacterales bacterium]